MLEQALLNDDTSSWREVAVTPLDGPSLGSFEFAQEGRRLVALYTDGRLRFWKSGSWSPERILKIHSRYSHALAVSPDGKWLATGSFDATKFAPDGRMLVSNADPIARAWFAPDLPQIDVASGISGKTP